MMQVTRMESFQQANDIALDWFSNVIKQVLVWIQCSFIVFQTVFEGMTLFAVSLAIRTI